MVNVGHVDILLAEEARGDGKALLTKRHADVETKNVLGPSGPSPRSLPPKLQRRKERSTTGGVKRRSSH